MSTIKSATTSRLLAIGIMTISVNLSSCGGGGGSENKPTTTEYFLGGSVSGLSGTITLKNSNGDTISQKGSGHFTFPTAFTTGASYSIDITNNSFGEKCSISRGNGVIGATSAQDILVDCGARRWQYQSNILLDLNPTAVSGVRLGISDLGNAFVIFTQTETSSGRTALYAAEGIAGLASSPVSWHELAALDNSLSISRPNLAVSPNGNAIATWESNKTCLNANTDAHDIIGGCVYLMASRKLANETAWETPVIYSSSHTLFGQSIPSINDAGDISILFDGSTSSSVADHRATVATRPASASSYRINRLDGFPLGSSVTLGQEIQYGMDRNGTITLAGQKPNTALSTTFSTVYDIAATLGTVNSGFSSVITNLESADREMTFYGMQVGTDGYVAALWSDRIASSAFATMTSVFSPVTGTWSPQDISAIGALTRPRSLTYLFWAVRVPDGTSGDVLIYRNCTLMARRNLRWGAPTALPSGCRAPGSIDAWSMDRNGNYVAIKQDGAIASPNLLGTWFSYNAADQIVKSIPISTPVSSDYLLGTAMPRIENMSMALAPTGYGVLTLNGNFSILPSPTLPAGTPSSTSQVWGIFFK